MIPKCLFFYEFSLLNELIANNKGGNSLLERKVFLTLYNGGEWLRDYINQPSTAIMHRTCLNLTGVIQPKFIIRQLIPQRTQTGSMIASFSYMPTRKRSTLERSKANARGWNNIEVFSILHRGHKENQEDFIRYHFDGTTVKEVKSFYNKLVERKAQILWDENRRGLLSKARQFMRMYMAKQAVQYALTAIKSIKEENGDPLNVDDDDLEWRKCVITQETVKRNAALMEYLIQVSSCKTWIYRLYHGLQL